MGILGRAAAAAFVFLALVVPTTGQAIGVDDAAEGKANITALIDEALHSFNGSMNREEKTAILRKMIAKYGDVDLSAKDVLGRYWNRATPEQQQVFPGLLLDYAIGSWVDQFGDMPAEERIDFISAETIESDRLLLRSAAVASTERTPVDWVLARNAEGRLAIVDVSVDGVSIIKAMGSDFTAIIRNGGGKIDVLIDALRKKIDAYAKGQK